MHVQTYPTVQKSPPLPQHIVATYGYSQTCLVWRYHLSPKLMWYIHAAYTTSSWPAAFTLYASLAVLMT